MLCTVSGCSPGGGAGPEVQACCWKRYLDADSISRRPSWPGAGTGNGRPQGGHIRLSHRSDTSSGRIAKSHQRRNLGPGTATVTPLAGQPTGTFHDALHLTISSGTGKYADATGTIEVRGIGYNIVGPAAGPGNSFFAVRYEGDICRAQ
jgi:hypothetical protein